MTEPSDPAPPERDLAMERHIRGIGLWFQVGSVVNAGELGWAWAHQSGEGLPFANVLITWVFCALGLVLGRAIWRFSRAARIIAGILCGLCLISNVATMSMGIAAGHELKEEVAQWVFTLVYFLAVPWALFGTRGSACFTASRELLREQSAVPESSGLRSPFFWAPLLFWISWMSLPPLFRTILR